MSELVKEWDLSSHGGFHRVGSSPAGSISLDGSQQLFSFFPDFLSWRAGSIPAVEQTTALVAVKKSTHPANLIRVPHSKYLRKPNFLFDHAITMVLVII